MPADPGATLFPPVGLDRADGSNGVGTADGDAITIIGSDGANLPDDSTFLEEYPDSPVIERAEQATITHRFRCDRTTGTTLITSFKRGDIVTDSFGNVTRILSNTLNFDRGGFCTLTMVAEGLSFDNPPDLFSIEIIELNPPADKHPRYNELTYQDRYNIRNSNVANAFDVTQDIMAVINSLPGAPPGGIGPIDTFAKTRYNEAKELLLKLFKGEESFYLPGFRLTWSRYFWAPQLLDPGGYIEEPITEGGLPFYFWSIDGTESPGAAEAPGLFENSWFGALANINPAIYGAGNGNVGGIQWLRQSDHVEYERTWFKITHSWQGGPLGHWDNEWYNIQPSRAPQPYQTNVDAKSVVL